jgi:protein-tyrosine phosphatase
MNGIDISGQRARDFRADDFEQFDLIYAMSSDVIRDMRAIARQKFNPEKTDLLMNLVQPGRNLDVPDPWYGPEAGYHEVFRMISQACDELLNVYSSGSENTVNG